MGLIDFVTNAGKKLFGGGEEEAAASAEAERVANEAKARALSDQVRALGFEVEQLSISFASGVATVRGLAASQAEREKVVLVVGNTQGVAQVDDQIQVAAPEPEAKFHTVVRGDTLSAIAKTYYGNAMKYPVIFEANRPMLENPDKIYPGQVLRIPPVD